MKVDEIKGKNCKDSKLRISTDVVFQSGLESLHTYRFRTGDYKKHTRCAMPLEKIFT